MSLSSQRQDDKDTDPENFRLKPSGYWFSAILLLDASSRLTGKEGRDGSRFKQLQRNHNRWQLRLGSSDLRVDESSVCSFSLNHPRRSHFAPVYVTRGKNCCSLYNNKLFEKIKEPSLFLTAIIFCASMQPPSPDRGLFF